MDGTPVGSRRLGGGHGAAGGLDSAISAAKRGRQRSTSSVGAHTVLWLRDEAKPEDRRRAVPAF